jgi:LemA protein
MPEHDQIETLLNEGKITAAQADLLKTALHESPTRGSHAALPPDPDDPQRQPHTIRSHVWTVFIALAIAMVLSVGYKPLFFFLLLVLMAAGCIGALCLVGYNFLVWKKEKVGQARSLVKNERNRQSALVPQIRDVVYDYATIETETIQKATHSRSSRGASTWGPQEESISSAEQAKEFQAVVENYPQIQSNQTFSKLLGELIETEDRITAMVQWHNYRAGIFNGLIESFPMSAIAALFGIQRADYLDE